MRLLRVKWLVHTYTALCRLYGFCALIGLCVRIRLFRFKRIVRTDTSFAYLQRLGDSVFMIHWFIWRSHNLILMFLDSFDVSVIHSTFVRPSWLVARRICPKDVIFRVIFPTIWSSDWTVLWVRLLDSAEILFWRSLCYSVSISYLGPYLWWAILQTGVVISICTMFFVCVVKSMFKGYWGYFGCNYDILD